MTSDDFAARSGMYRLLGRLWLQEIDIATLQELCAAPLRVHLAEAGASLPTQVDQDTVDTLAIDYCQLFVGPSKHLPPIQSVWESGQFESETTTSVRQFIDIINYPVQRLPGGAMHDHLGVELDVMAEILNNAAVSAPGEEQHEAAGELASAFYLRHLNWPHDLMTAATERAATEFYRDMIDMTREFLKSEAAPFS